MKKNFRAPLAPPYVWPVAVDPWQLSGPGGQGGGGGGSRVPEPMRCPPHDPILADPSTALHSSPTPQTILKGHLRIGNNLNTLWDALQGRNMRMIIQALCQDKRIKDTTNLKQKVTNDQSCLNTYPQPDALRVCHLSGGPRCTGPPHISIGKTPQSLEPL